MRIVAASLPCLLAATAAHGADKVARDDPAWLRAHHAGMETLTVHGTVADAFVTIRDGVATCYFDTGTPLRWLGVAGVIVQESVRKKLKVELAGDKSSGYVVYGVKAFWYAPAFQFDIRASGQDVEVTYYYDNDNAMQRQAFDNAKAWLDGKPATCTGAH